jgi:hypothetical protein
MDYASEATRHSGNNHDAGTERRDIAERKEQRETRWVKPAAIFAGFAVVVSLSA